MGLGVTIVPFFPMGVGLLLAAIFPPGRGSSTVVPFAAQDAASTVSSDVPEVLWGAFCTVRKLGA